MRLLLADAGKEFKDTKMNPQMMAAFKKNPPVPMMAPPLIRHGDFYINQMAACVQYLAKLTGYEPADTKLAAIALKVLLDCNDCIDNLSRNNGHKMWDGPEEKNPPKGGKPYPAWRAFVDPNDDSWYGKRLPRWLSIFTETGVKFGTLKPDSGFMLGDKLSYADISVFHVVYLLDTLKMESYVTHLAPLLRALSTRIRKRPGIDKFLTEQQKAMAGTTCGGQIQKSLQRIIALGIHTECIAEKKS